jgi:hypothetical protein
VARSKSPSIAKSLWKGMQTFTQDADRNSPIIKNMFRYCEQGAIFPNGTILTYKKALVSQGVVRQSRWIILNDKPENTSLNLLWIMPAKGGRLIKEDLLHGGPLLLVKLPSCRIYCSIPQ